MQLRITGQIVVVWQTKDNHYGAVSLIERIDNDKWVEIATALPAEIGRNGIAKFGEKAEGDGKTPSGVYPLSMVFGYDERVETKMPYRQATEKDYWIDDVKCKTTDKLGHEGNCREDRS